jgi:hypothetical protein
VQNAAQAGLIIFGAIVLFGIAQRVSVYLRRGRPTL